MIQLRSRIRVTAQIARLLNSICYMNVKYLIKTSVKSLLKFLMEVSTIIVGTEAGQHELQFNILCVSY